MREKVAGIKDSYDRKFESLFTQFKEIESLFGKYDEQIPADILRYMRKNPQLIMNRLAKVYGNKFLDYAEKAYIKYGR